MKKTIVIIFFAAFIFHLHARNVNDYDSGYIASIKNNRCFKVPDYPGKDVRPSILLKEKSCEIISDEESIQSLIIACTDETSEKSVLYLYRMSSESCGESLEAAKKRMKWCRMTYEIHETVMMKIPDL